MNLRVVNNNTPGWTLIVETAPNVTLDVGTELVVADPVKRAYALLWSVMTDDRRVHEARRLLLGTLTKEQQHAALAGGAEPKPTRCAHGVWLGDRCEQCAPKLAEAFIPPDKCGVPNACRANGECISETPCAAEPASASPTMDQGPWTVFRDDVSGYPIGIGSDDFKRDVLLRVDGDFGCATEKADYCAWLAGTLNLASGLSHCPHCGQWHNLSLGC